MVFSDQLNFELNSWFNSGTNFGMLVFRRGTANFTLKNMPNFRQFQLSFFEYYIKSTTHYRFCICSSFLKKVPYYFAQAGSLGTFFVLGKNDKHLRCSGEGNVIYTIIFCYFVYLVPIIPANPLKTLREALGGLRMDFDIKLKQVLVFILRRFGITGLLRQIKQHKSGSKALKPLCVCNYTGPWG